MLRFFGKIAENALTLCIFCIKVINKRRKPLDKGISALLITKLSDRY